MNIRAAVFVRNLRGLSPSEKCVAAMMASHADYRDAVVNASMSTLAVEAGLENRESASRIVKRLELTFGIIRAVGARSGGRKPTKYAFTFKFNRDSGITVTCESESSNRDSTVTVSPPNRDFGRSATVTEIAPTVTPRSHEGFKENLLLKENLKENPLRSQMIVDGTEVIEPMQVREFWSVAIKQGWSRDAGLQMLKYEFGIDRLLDLPKTCYQDALRIISRTPSLYSLRNKPN